MCSGSTVNSLPYSRMRSPNGRTRRLMMCVSHGWNVRCRCRSSASSTRRREHRKRRLDRLHEERERQAGIARRHRRAAERVGQQSESGIRLGQREGERASRVVLVLGPDDRGRIAPRKAELAREHGGQQRAVLLVGGRDACDTGVAIAASECARSSGARRTTGCSRSRESGRGRSPRTRRRTRRAAQERPPTRPRPSRRGTGTGASASCDGHRRLFAQGVPAGKVGGIVHVP